MATETLLVANNGTPWTAPDGVTTVKVEMWGGGGKGSTRTTNGAGGGGGGGAYSVLNAYAVTPGNTYAFQVGAGSTSTSSGASNDTYWVSTATGLAKAGASLADNVGTAAAGGAGGSGVGDTRRSGGDGAAGSDGNNGGGGGSSAGTGADGNSATNGTGATAPTGGGNGGDGKSSPQGNGSDGSAPGGGGGGGLRTSGGTRTGGNGADGKIVLTYEQSFTIPQGSATATGQQPTISIDSPAGPIEIPVAQATGAATGQAPGLSENSTIAVGAGAVAHFGAGPTVKNETGSNLGGGGPGLLAALGLNMAASANTSIPVGAGAATATGHEPTPFGEDTIAVGQGSLTATGYAPSATGADTIAVGQGSLAATGHAPVPFGQDTIAVGQGSLTATGHEPSVAGADTIAIGQGSLTAAGHEPVPFGEDFIAIGAGAATASGRDPHAVASDGPQAPPMLAGAAEIEGFRPQAVISKRVTFPFAAGAEGFVGTPGTGTAMAWTGADGNPAGSLQTSTTGKNRNANSFWSIATDWQALGIPAGMVITSVTAASADSRCSEYTNGQASTLSAITLTPTGSQPITLAASRSITGADSWTTQSGVDATGLELASGGSLTIRSDSNLRTTNVGSPVVTLRQDNITFVVSFTASKVLDTPEGVATLTGYAPSILGDAAVVATPGAGSLSANTAGVTPVVTAPVTGGGGGPGLLVALGLNLEQEPFAPARGTITGFAPVISDPISLAGSDDTYSERATLEAEAVKLTASPNPIFTPAKADLTATGQDVSESHAEHHWANPAQRTLVITRFAPTLAVTHVRDIPAGAAAITGRTPEQNDQLLRQPDAGLAALSGRAPVVAFAGAADPDVGAAAATGYAPALYSSHIIEPGVGGLTSTGLVPDSIGFATHTGSAALASRVATVSGTARATHAGSGALQSLMPIPLVGSGVRGHFGSGAPASGPASTSGGIIGGTGFSVTAGEATILARGTVGRYTPDKRPKPQKVNRYNVALKPTSRNRVRNPRKR